MAIVRRERADGKVAYRVVAHTPTQGHVTIGTFSRKKDAELAEAEFRRQALLGGIVKLPSKATVSELADSWYASRRGKLETMRKYSQAVFHTKSFFSTMKVIDVTTKEVEEYVTDLVGHGLAPSTINVYVRLTRSMFKSAVSYGYITQNPAEGVRALPVRGLVTERVRVLTAEEHERLVVNTRRDFQTMMYIAPLVGLRLSELLGLTWDCVDLDKRRIHVRHQLAQEGNVLVEPKTASSVRTVDLSRHVVAKLREWKLECIPTEMNLVFPSRLKLPMHRVAYYKVFHAAREAAGLPEVKTHDFRHTFVSWLIADGASVKYVQAQCGHASAQVTMDTYAHLWSESEPDVMERVAARRVAATLPRKEEAQVTGS
jgi:integrase